MSTDIDDRKRAEALLAGEKRLLEMVVGGHSMSEILEALCRLVESTASGFYCSVVLVYPRGTRLEHHVGWTFGVRQYDRTRMFCPQLAYVLGAEPLMHFAMTRPR
jgi:hypothetical protein